MNAMFTLLNENLFDDVYMTQLECYVTLENAKKVSKLQQSTYGLNQASHSWYLLFNDAIKEFGFTKNKDESCVYCM